MDFNLIIISIYSYLLGSIPFGLLLTNIFLKKDIRKIGSGNIGTTNVLRTGNKTLAIATLVFDLLKGYVSVYVTLLYYESLIFYSALICFIGHIFPIWLKFKGGKGVACFFGGNLILMPIPTVFAMIIWLLVVKFSKLSSFGALLSIFVLTSYELIFIYGTLNKVIILLLFVLIFLKHSSNIKRLIKGQENKIDL